MAESTNKSGRVLGIIALALVCTILGALAGGVAGGVAGYFVGHRAARTETQRLSGRLAPERALPLAPQAPRGWGNEGGPATDMAMVAQVSQVTADSPAAKAGLRVGDRIVAVDGQALSPDRDLAQIISQHKTGDRVELTIQRAGQEQKTQVTLGEKPDQAGKPYLGISYRLMLSGMPNLPSS